MKCERCDGELRVTNTYSGVRCRTSIAVCVKCHTKNTLVTLNMGANKARGHGAVTLLKRVEARLNDGINAREALIQPLPERHEA